MLINIFNFSKYNVYDVNIEEVSKTNLKNLIATYTEYIVLS